MFAVFWIREQNTELCSGQGWAVRGCMLTVSPNGWWTAGMYGRCSLLLPPHSFHLLPPRLLLVNLVNLVNILLAIFLIPSISFLLVSSLSTLLKPPHSFHNGIHILPLRLLLVNFLLVSILLVNLVNLVNKSLLSSSFLPSPSSSSPPCQPC